MITTTDVIYEVADGIATITLNRPDDLNTMGGQLVPLALRAMEQAAADDSVRAVILTGAGRAFCAGGDLRGMSAAIGGEEPPTLEASIARLRAAMHTSDLLHEMPKVTIAAINGACAGAGLAWACACDLRYCSESARFNTAFMTAGLSGDFGGTWTLPRIVGPAKARELYLLAEKFDAEEAAGIGLVSAVLPDAELMPFVRERAARLAGFAPLTLRAIKANLNDSLVSGFAEQLDREAERHVRCGRTEDAREAARAFLEKRQPVFQGR
jgi:2-(1,2-epoxy-1,2-dihydrophenyl)acetyl-CoA isomerase